MVSDCESLRQTRQSAVHAIENRSRLQHSQPRVLIGAKLFDGHAHPIKVTEACLREYALNPKPVYLVAAQHAIENMTG